MIKIAKIDDLNISNQDLQEVIDVICSSMETVSPVVITFISDQYELVIGFIHLYNEGNSYIRVIDLFDECYEIPIKNIVFINNQSAPKVVC